jgi:ATP synthase protein I
MRQVALAMDLPFLMIGAVMGGGLIGYALDQWLHTGPWLMLILGGLGFVAGLRAMLQALAVRTNKQPRGKPPEKPGGGTGIGQGE